MKATPRNKAATYQLLRNESNEVLNPERLKFYIGIKHARMSII